MRRSALVLVLALVEVACHRAPDGGVGGLAPDELALSHDAGGGAAPASGAPAIAVSAGSAAAGDREPRPSADGGSRVRLRVRLT
jgi:hypothetical protein